MSSNQEPMEAAEARAKQHGTEVLTEARAYALIEAAFYLIETAQTMGAGTTWLEQKEAWLAKYKRLSPLRQRPGMHEV